MSLRPGGGSPVAALLHPEEAVCVEPQRSGAEMTERVKRIPDDQPHSGERRIQPVYRRLTVLEIVQVDPTPLDPVRAGDRCGRTPIRVLDARLLEDHPLHPPNEVAGPLQPV